MTNHTAHGDSFYLREAQRAGALGADDFVLFHNPGIVAPVQHRSPPGLTETVYIEHALNVLRARGHTRIALIGFSAGSMLTIATAARADELDAQRGGARLLTCAVAIHGPDRIRDVFETHVQWPISRLDRLFSLSLYLTMRYKARAHIALPHLHSWLCDGTLGGRLKWLGGWEWMRALTEATFQRSWASMENAMWSCRPCMLHKLRTPVLRILARNDPIVNYATCVDESLFCNLDCVIVTDDGGHCAAFGHCDALGARVRAWSAQHAEACSIECDDAATSALIAAEVGGSGRSAQ